MNTPGWLCRWCGGISGRGLLLLGLWIATWPWSADAGDSAAVRKLFAQPPREFSSGPLWVWNDLLTEEQVRGTLQDLAAQHVRQVWVHPRPGLITPYLGEDWFRLWKVALQEAARLDLNVWIYDENSYPSGFAGGWVPEMMPEARGRGLELREVKGAPTWRDNSLGVYRIDDQRSEAVSAALKRGEAVTGGRFMEAAMIRAGNSPWHGGRSYVDLLYPGVTEKFLELTMEPYRREIGSEFGGRVPGVFTDEPNIRPAGGLPWTDDLPAVFARRRGYTLLEHLPSLKLPVGDWRRVRHDYYQVLNELFIERWAKPYHDHCEKARLEWTGHYWDHDWPDCVGVPDNMAMYAWHQRPAIDCLMNQYREDTHAQFGNVRMVRELASVANQMGTPRTLCELYGAGGWDLRFEDMKRIADWLGVLGVNTFNEHLSYVSLRGARKRDHPQSFSYHEPWWDAYHVMEDYLTRLSVAVSQGEPLNRVLVLEPTTTAWMYQGDGRALSALGDSFFRLLLSLESRQIEYDLGCEDVLARHASVEGGVFRVGRGRYNVVVLPQRLENLNVRTVELLEQWLAGGGAVISLGPPPVRVDGAESDRAAKLATAGTWQSVAAEEAPTILRERAKAGAFGIARAPRDQGILFHQRRSLEDGELLFLVNSSIEFPSTGTVQSDLAGVEEWDLQTGAVKPYPFSMAGTRLRAAFELPPSGSRLLFLSRRARTAAEPVAEVARSVAASGPLSARRVGPNVLTLDHVGLKVRDQSWTNLYFYEANLRIWQGHGMERNPWDSAVQFKDELLRKTFAPDSGFAATYTFKIDGSVPTNLAIVIERPDLYRVTCNDQAVVTTNGSWWLDRAFRRIELSSVARRGVNTVRLEAGPFTIFHELEPAYLLGDFSLKPAEAGFVVTGDAPLHLGAWNGQGQPFYSEGVAYRQTFAIDRVDGRYVVALGNWRGSVARVAINGRAAGYVSSPPWRCDVTDAIRTGVNEVEVVVVGTLKNTLGPHHGNPAPGSAWPGMFQRAPKLKPPPGAQYSTIGYGLFEPFTLHQLSPVAAR